ncbi:hypothetical protein RB595_007088 [Gaeumannomyces hyphopodioides]
MPAIGTTAVGLMAGLHGYIMVLEMFLWTTPRGRKAFKLTQEFAEKTKVLAANQGLYNGFLMAGLVWGLAHPVPDVARQIKLFFLGCITVAGVYGGLTSNKKIIFIQGIPGAISAAAVLLGL